MKNWDVLEKAYGGNSEGDRQIISDMRSEMKNETENFSNRFKNVEVHAPAKSNDENRCWPKKITKTNYCNQADFFRAIHIQFMLAIRGLGRFHQVKPLTNAAGPGAEGEIELTLEGLRELRKAVSDYRAEKKRLDQDEAEMIYGFRRPQKEPQVKLTNGDQEK